MIRSRIGLLFVLLIVTSATAQTTASSADLRAQKFGAKDAERVLAAGCRPLRITADFPAKLKMAFTKITQQDEFALANPGERFQETDVMEHPKLPRRRLILAGKCEGFWFIHYERGGLAHSYEVVFFKDDPYGEPSLVWGGAGFKRASNLIDLRSAIASKSFSDNLDFYW